MSRLMLVTMGTLLVSCFILNGGQAIRLSTKLLYKQAFVDGFWRGLAGKNAVVSYTPVNHNGYTYYQPHAKYYTPPHGHGLFGLGSLFNNHGHGHAQRSQGLGGYGGQHHTEVFGQGGQGVQGFGYSSYGYGNHLG